MKIRIEDQGDLLVYQDEVVTIHIHSVFRPSLMSSQYSLKYTKVVPRTIGAMWQVFGPEEFTPEEAIESFYKFIEGIGADCQSIRSIPLTLPIEEVTT